LISSRAITGQWPQGAIRIPRRDTQRREISQPQMEGNANEEHLSEEN
jgi:hypothetical protein